MLGSVELRLHGQGARTTSERARRLLALLAWQPNEFVSDEAAIEQIWDDKVPRHPRDALYTCATRLRHAFGTGPQAGRVDPVVRRRGGYLLTVSADSVDLHRFRQLVRMAREMADRSDLAVARQILDRAFTTWGGTPVADLRSDWAARVRVALERERLAASIDRAALGLRLGRHAEEVPTLYGLLEEHPLNEAIAGLLMLALHRSGCQNEALACFALVRQRTVEQLGDEPGCALQELHQAVLCRDPRLMRAELPPMVGAAA